MQTFDIQIVDLKALKFFLWQIKIQYVEIEMHFMTKYLSVL